jgi:two-component system NarL family sensor kinase
VARRGPDEPFGPADARLLQSIARQAGAALHAVRLTHDLQRARPHRDLHDGLGPGLASQGLKLAAARQLLHRDPTYAARLLDEIIAQNEHTVADVRRLVYGLRPPTLDELGLVEAIRDDVDRLGGTTGHMQTTVHAPLALPPIPAAAEVAAYRIVQEALTNARRHAHAQQCDVRLLVDERLMIVVEDDGLGLSTPIKTGVGLNSMRERTVEVGGICTIHNRPEGGVRVTATLPLHVR